MNDQVNHRGHRRGRPRTARWVVRTVAAAVLAVIVVEEAGLGAVICSRIVIVGIAFSRSRRGQIRLGCARRGWVLAGRVLAGRVRSGGVGCWPGAAVHGVAAGGEVFEDGQAQRVQGAGQPRAATPQCPGVYVGLGGEGPAGVHLPVCQRRVPGLLTANLHPLPGPPRMLPARPHGLRVKLLLQCGGLIDELLEPELGGESGEDLIR